MGGSPVGAHEACDVDVVGAVNLNNKHQDDYIIYLIPQQLYLFLFFVDSTFEMYLKTVVFNTSFLQEHNLDNSKAV